MAIARYAVFSMMSLLAMIADCWFPIVDCRAKLLRIHQSAIVNRKSAILVLRGYHSGALRRATVKHVADVIHVRNQARLRAMDCGQSQSCFKRGHLCLARATGSGYPLQAFFGHLERRLAYEDSGDRR